MKRKKSDQVRELRKGKVKDCRIDSFSKQIEGTLTLFVFFLSCQRTWTFSKKSKRVGVGWVDIFPLFAWDDDKGVDCIFQRALFY